MKLVMIGGSLLPVTVNQVGVDIPDLSCLSSESVSKIY